MVILVIAKGERYRCLTSCIKFVSALEVLFKVCENAYFLFEKAKLLIKVLPLQNSKVTYPNMWKPHKAEIYEFL